MRRATLHRWVSGESVTGHILWVLGLFVAVGLCSAFVWVWLWTPAQGLVLDGQLVLLGDGPRQAFDSTGWFLLIGSVAGLVTGGCVAMLARNNELVTLVSLVTGSIAAALLMRWVGYLLGPADPAPIAARSVDYTSLPVALDLPGAIATLALPIGALAGFLIAVVLSPTRRRSRSGSDDSVGMMPR